MSIVSVGSTTSRSGLGLHHMSEEITTCSSFLQSAYDRMECWSRICRARTAQLHLITVNITQCTPLSGLHPVCGWSFRTNDECKYRDVQRQVDAMGPTHEKLFDWMLTYRPTQCNLSIQQVSIWCPARYRDSVDALGHRPWVTTYGPSQSTRY